jgi:outer membrane protein assembly factor BamB
VSDEDLRELERRARAGGPAEKLALAAALDRLGREDDALEVLIAGREAPDVRREIARRLGDIQMLLHLQSCPSGLRPIVSSPRARWAVRPRVSAATPRIVTSFLASPLGVVRASSESVAVLDPDTGTLRHRLPGATGIAIVGETLLTHDLDTIRAHDLWTGRALWGVSVPRGMKIQSLGVVGERIVCRSARVLAAYDLNGGRAPSLAWTADVFDDPEPPSEPTREIVEMLGLRSFFLGTVSLSPRLIVVSTSHTLVAIDPDDGHERWRGQGSSPLIDAANGDVGFLRGDELVLASAEGAERWRTVGRLAPIGFTERALVCLIAPSVVVLDRQSGRERARFDFSPSAAPVLVRDTIVAATGAASIGAFTLEGRRLWSFDLPDTRTSTSRAIFWRVAALPRALVISSFGDQAIVCLEEGESR